MSEKKDKQRSRPSRSSWSIWPRRPSQWGLAASVSVLVTASFLTAIGVWVLLSWAMTGGLPFFAHAQPIDINGADLLRNALFVVGGLGGVVALTVNYRKRRDAELGQFGLDFAAAAEQLGGQSAAVRIAGVYAMAALADRSQAHTERQQQCVDALCAYLRLPYQPDPTGAMASALHRTTVKLPDGTIREEERTYITQPQEREVRLTIISVIRDHLRPGARSSWSGRDFDFTGAVFDGGDFSKVEFTAGVFSFRDAKFSRNVSFGGAEFSGAKVNFGAAEFSDGKVNFEYAEFSGGIVNFGAARFSGGIVNFGTARFSGGTVDFESAEFSDGEVNFGTAKFSAGKVDFWFAKFSGGTVDLSRPRSWEVPPRGLPDPPPKGLLLPRK